MIKKHYNLFLVPIAVLLVILFLFGQQFWQLSLANVTLTDKVTPKFIQLAFLKELFLLSKNVLLIFLGFLFAKEKNFRYVRVVKLWLLAVAVSFSLQIILVCLNKTFDFNSVYATVFPILKGTYYLGTGTLLGLLLWSFSQEWLLNLSWAKLIFLLTIIIGLPNVFSVDPLKLLNGDGLLFGTFLFLAGSLISTKKPLNKKWALALTICGSGSYFILNYWMPYISHDVHSNYQTALRFLNNGMVFSVLAAVGLTSLVMPYFKPNRTLSNLLGDFTYLGLLLGTNTLLQNAVKIYFDRKFTSLEVQKKAYSLLLQVLGETGWLILASLILFAVTYLPALKHWDKQWENFDFNAVTTWLAKALYANKHFLAVIFGAILLSYASFVAVSSDFKVTLNMGPTYSAFKYALLARPMMIWLNALIILALWALILALTNRFWVASLGTGLLTIILLVVEAIKVSVRNEPVLPSEIVMLKASGELLRMVDFRIVILAGVGIALTVALIVFLERRFKFGRQKPAARLILAVIPLLFLQSSLYLNHTKGKIHAVSSALGNDPTFYNQLLGAQKNGPLLQFINNIDTKVMDKPQGYSKATMQKLAQKYNNYAKNINLTRTNTLANQNVIFSLSESFADPRRVPGVTLANNPIPKIQKLIQSNTSGLMLSAGYGGGTANMEYMTLTGLNVANFSATLPTPYTQLVPFQNNTWSFNQLFGNSDAIHPYQGVFYSRTTVYDKFGFNRFYYLDSKYKITSQEKIGRSPYIDDNTAFANTLKVLKQNKQGTFINLISMQNHFPYYKKYYDGTQKYAATGSSVTNNTTATMIANYATGLSYTDKAVAKFIKQIDALNKPVTLVFYGDHLPGIYSNNMQKDGVLLHETDYFIYSNKYAVSHGAKKVLNVKKLVSPTDFIALVAKQTNSKVNGYIALLTKVFKKLPAISTNPTMNTTNSYNTRATFVTSSGKVLKLNQLSKKKQKLFHEYQLMQYDLTAGKQYLLQDKNFSK